ncbi:MAG: SUMF1/EgtB/PvdO family nonheme iron enzyme, partial [Anaerolineales bacterium]|nr:SUMF1/EgtB/PvdO family nonheme iron enzyme [Anaerolineales bacterium]
PNADWSPVVREFNGLPMVYVPAGCFVIGSTDPQIDAALEQCRADYGPCERDWFTDEKPRSEVCLDAFWIGQTEVTNAQYQACVQAGACSPLKDRRYAGNDNHPVVSVDWFQARDYAAWVGGALPSEAQWEYAARGPQGLQYPWGEEVDENRLNYCDANCANEWRHAAYDDGYAQTAPVGSFPAGASWVGALDLSGNVWEWTSTLYQGYPYRAGDGREDPASAGWGRVLRGGSWTDGRFNARAADRLWLQPSTTDFHYGFRIVMAENGPTSDAGAVEIAPEPTGVMLRVWGQETPLRAAPTTGAAEIARLPPGIRLEILGRNAEASYFLVSYQGQQGWVWLSYVSVLGDLSAVPVIGAEPVAVGVRVSVKRGGTPLREAPSVSAIEIAQLPVGVQLDVLGKDAHGLYVFVAYQGHEGWVPLVFLTMLGDLSAVPVIGAEPVAVGVRVSVKRGGTPLREAPSVSAIEIAQLPVGVQLDVLGKDAHGLYVFVAYQGHEGWVPLVFLTMLGDLDSAVPVIVAEPEGVLALVGSRAVIIYAAPDLYADRIETVENVELPITGRTASGQWYRIEWQGREAWIVNSYYLRIEGDKNALPVVEVEAETEVAPTPTQPPPIRSSASSCRQISLAQSANSPQRLKTGIARRGAALQYVCRHHLIRPGAWYWTCRQH